MSERPSPREVLESAPAVAAWNAERERLREEEAALVAQVAEINEADAAALAEWQQATAEATEAREPLPPRPVPRDQSHVGRPLSMVRWALSQHAEKRAQAVAADAKAVRAKMLALEVERQAEIATFAEPLRRLQAEAKEAANVMRQVVQAEDKAAGKVSHPGRAARIIAQPDIETLMAAAEAGRTLLEPLPLVPTEPKIQGVDDYSPFGMDRSGRLGYEDHDRPPPPPKPHREAAWRV